MDTLDPVIGRRIGGYRVTELLGEGGMGKVYLLVHCESPELRRVIKVVHAWIEHQHPGLVERFLREARAAASLRHPNIIEILDYARFAEDDQPYLLMPFLDGADLGAYAARESARSGHPGRLSFEQALPLLLQLCAALQAAHLRGIIHRDLKPSNCYVVAGAHAYPRLILLDFGIAKVLDPSLRQGDATQSRAVLGTPGYMAPEQARGLEISHLADLYSFGVLAYEILTGERPFKGRTSEDLVIQQVNTTPPVLSAVVPELPAGVSQLIMQCLEPVPQTRPATVAEVAQCLIRAARDGREVALAVAPDLLAPRGDRGPTEPTIATRAAPPQSDYHFDPRRRALHGGTGHRVRRATRQMGALAAVVGFSTAIVIASVDVLNGQRHEPGAGSATSPPPEEVEPGPAPDASAPSAGAAAGEDAGAAPAIQPHTQAQPTGAPRPTAPVSQPAPRPDPAAQAPEQPARQGSGEVEIFVQPWAEIWLDGKSMGQTPFRKRLSSRRYQLRLVNEDMSKSETLVITVTTDQTTTIRRTW